MKKQYMKPAMRVVTLRHQSHILVGSFGVEGVNAPTENFIWKEGFFGDLELDM